ncbi:butyrophilin subfamily 2 member A2-like, partial [Motacilla alba alba]|uniref:butyrophilin subfamily 2 member A2-like n=1 Tax=Motacilla alba alba TaxID=1094192 RepID=UPI0018D54022
LDFFQDPVMILSCGHNFCRRCLLHLASALGQPSQSISGFRPSWQLANVVAAVQEPARLLAQDLCHRHQRPVTLFCQHDGVLVCTACMSITPTPPCCSKGPLAATGHLGVFSGERLRGRAAMTLDPATAHPQILVSLDGQTAGHWESSPAPLPLGMEWFESLCCVLGQQDFVEDWLLWSQPQMWGVGRGAVLGQLQALTWPSPTSLPHSHTVQSIEVAVDYTGGWVAFCDAYSQTEVFAFPPPTYAGE